MKKILALTMAAAMSLSLAACGGGNNSANSTPAASSNPPASSSTQNGGDATSPTPSGGFTTVQPGKLIMSTEAGYTP